MTIDKIAAQEELCKKNIELSQGILTDIKDWMLYPIKMQLSYCRTCDSYTTIKGEAYCLKKRD
jgi:hypothetical protein